MFVKSKKSIKCLLNILYLKIGITLNFVDNVIYEYHLSTKNLLRSIYIQPCRSRSMSKPCIGYELVTIVLYIYIHHPCCISHYLWLAHPPVIFDSHQYFPCLPISQRRSATARTCIYICLNVFYLCIML